MNDKLIEAVARAMCRTVCDKHVHYCRDCDSWNNELDYARAAIAAIEASGSHRVVPVVPTEDMCMAAHRRTAGWLSLEHQGSGLTQALIKARLRYVAMLAAAPKVVE